jgi:hypothetical protein
MGKHIMAHEFVKNYTQWIFDSCHPEKAAEARNVHVALATDGFNPYGLMAAPYTCWPVFVTPLNLPPGIMFKRQFVFVLDNSRIPRG